MRLDAAPAPSPYLTTDEAAAYLRFASRYSPDVVERDGLKKRRTFPGNQTQKTPTVSLAARRRGKREHGELGDAAA